MTGLLEGYHFYGVFHRDNQNTYCLDKLFAIAFMAIKDANERVTVLDKKRKSRCEMEDKFIVY
jgi:hypothetical protein